ncbi:uncharacterized protein LOC115034404 [Acyrthosiphon pisum]|uniref:Uncharacterized protein n=1 Tax=Acyrthosiphon pisum TaxID=7029 RepID=A0A8R2JUV9_ACYPI|nr:uncharacterized protein LOC115034404 [Acyrthosiphon pisum]
MAALKLIFILIVGDFVKHVMLYNPMLTYTIRFKKVSMHPNILGNFTIQQYRESQFVNGNFTIPPSSFPDKIHYHITNGTFEIGIATLLYPQATDYQWRVTQKFYADEKYVIVVIYRCDSEGINCEYFQTWTITDICPKLKDKNQIWSRWYSSYNPPMVCPIDKVNYRVVNGTFDIDQLILWYSDMTNYQWKVTQKNYAGNIYIGSYVFQISIFSYRKKLKPLLKL